MRLASFSIAGNPSWGLVRGDEVLNVGAVLPEFGGLRQVLAAQAYEQVRSAGGSARRLRFEQVRWLPVIPDPQKILCVGLNYETHRLETGRAEAGHPTLFTRFADTQIGHAADIVRPRVSTALDYEGELAVIIGAAGRYIRREDAMAHVAGYACYNDATLRDWQQHTTQFTPGKNFPGTGALGPWLVTADEIADVGALRLTTRVNGRVVQQAGLDQLIFSIPVLIEYCSAFTPLSPGDVIATGTPGGVGFKREPPLFLRGGDRVEVEISQVGLLANGIADEVG